LLNLLGQFGNLVLSDLDLLTDRQLPALFHEVFHHLKLFSQLLVLALQEQHFVLEMDSL